MHWLDLFSQFDMTICHVPRKSSAVTDALSCHLGYAAVVISVKSSLLTQIREVQAAATGDSWKELKKLDSISEHGFIFHDGLLCCTRGRSKISLVIPEDAGITKTNRLAPVVLR